MKSSHICKYILIIFYKILIKYTFHSRVCLGIKFHVCQNCTEILKSGKIFPDIMMTFSSIPSPSASQNNSVSFMEPESL
jgi:hypothetical protein